MKRKIRIVFYDEGIQGETQLGGGQLARLALMKRLDPERFEPILLTSKDWELAEKARNLGISVHVEPIASRFKRFYRHSWFLNPARVLGFGINVLPAAYRLALTLKKLEADILHPNENFSRTIAVFSRPWHSSLLITHISDEWNRGLTDRLMRSMFKRFYDKLIAVSEKTARIVGGEDYSAVGKIAKIYTGIDLERFNGVEPENLRRQFEVPENAILFGTIGKLIHFKGQQLVIEALSQLKRQGLDQFVYLLVGNGPAKEELVKQVQESGLSDQVKFAGYRDNIPGIIQGLDFVIQPSLTESFGLAVLEGLACGKLVITSNVGIVDEIYDMNQSQFVFEAGNVDSIAQILFDLLKNSPDTLRKMGSEGASIAQRFDINASVRQTEDLYSSLVA